MTSSTKRQLRPMAGEFFRESGVLVAVLSPLEGLVSRGRLTIAWGVATLVISAVCPSLGFWLGVERE